MVFIKGIVTHLVVTVSQFVAQRLQLVTEFFAFLLEVNRFHVVSSGTSAELLQLEKSHIIETI